MEQTIITIGNSQGIIIPQKILGASGIKVGDKVIVEEKDKKITVSPVKKASQANDIVDAEVYAVAKKLLKRYGKAFAQLANK